MHVDTIRASAPEPQLLSERFRSCIREQSAGSTVVSLDRHQSLYRLGERDNRHLYLIERGRIKTLVVTGSGKECLLDILGCDDVIGESSRLGDERTETAAAMAPSGLRPVHRRHFLEILADGSLREE